MIRLLLALLALIAACDEDERECTSPGEPFEHALDERWSDPKSCNSHDECIAAAADLVCGDELVYTGCPRAIHRDSRDELDAVIDGIAADQCPGACGYAWSDCFGGPRCIDGSCTWTVDYDSGIGHDAGPADAGAVDAAPVDAASGPGG